MDIVLNEIEWAAEMLRSGTIGKPATQALTAIAKYYYREGYPKKEVREKLEQYLLRADPTATPVSWSDTLDRITKFAAKHPPVIVDSVVITKPEMEAIAAVETVQQKRLAFTLLCLAKLRYAINPYTDHWVNTPDTDIMRMANIKTSVRRQSQMYAALRDSGLIRFSRKVDCLSVQVLFCAEGEPEMEITDFRSLGYQYLRHLEPQKFFVCQNCGVVERIPDDKKRGRPKKYCDACAYQVYLSQSVTRAAGD